MDSINNDIKKRVNIREVYRYLGYGGGTPDDDIKTLIKDILENLTDKIKPKYIYKVYSCSISESGVLLEDSKGTLVFDSRNLASNLAQCSSVILLAATLGIEADKLLQKYEILNMAKAAIIQACGAACIEAYCNILQEKICDTCSAEGNQLYLRPRFSPGYGDLPLQYQKLIFDELECTKRIGLTLTDSLLMYPTKSVTAFIGLTANPQGWHPDAQGYPKEELSAELTGTQRTSRGRSLPYSIKCETCDNTECEFRGGV